MTKWARMRRRKEKRKSYESLRNSTFEENQTDSQEQEKASVDIKRPQEEQKTESPKTSESNTILSQIPRYIYLVAIFALLAGVFFPLITARADSAYNFVIGGTATLFLGLTGGILLFKSTTTIKRPTIFLAVGSAFIAISLTLIYLMQEWWYLEFHLT